MNRFRTHTGLVAPLDRSNIDTDQIIPKQFLKRIERSGFGQFLFYDWRHGSSGEIEPEFVLNQARYQSTSILVTGKNFGCGSSREHAVWALSDFGFRVVLAPSFADIFANNAAKNGLLTVALSPGQVTELVRRAREGEPYRLTIDLEQQKVSDAQGFSAEFQMDNFVRHCLLEGLDHIGLTLEHEEEIARYEARHPLPSRVRIAFHR
ncbi:MAG: 3-isopropylmalate dehydratase small subunit [Acidobacteria bacterium]|nr:3-isopropylmalate dehydratase small subunit [Acidobacteriota bacterium]